MTEKLAKNTFKIQYSNGEEIIIKPSSFRKLEDIETLSKALVREMVDVDGHIGSLLKGSNKVFWGHCEKLAALLNVVGQDEPGIDLDLIEDADEIVRVFVTSTEDRHPETGSIYTPEGKTLLPSEVCRINSLSFTQILKEVQEELTNPPKKKKTSTSK